MANFFQKHLGKNNGDCVQVLLVDDECIFVGGYVDVLDITYDHIGEGDTYSETGMNGSKSGVEFVKDTKPFRQYLERKGD